MSILSYYFFYWQRGVGLVPASGDKPRQSGAAGGKVTLEDLDGPGSINGVPALEFNIDTIEDKPWNKPGADISGVYFFNALSKQLRLIKSLINHQQDILSLTIILMFYDLKINNNYDLIIIKPFIQWVELVFIHFTSSISTVYLNTVCFVAYGFFNNSHCTLSCLTLF